jgi:DNA (cytosine-5)-methyltransferase 1
MNKEEFTNFSEYSVVDLFCGIGGLSHGFFLEGFQVKLGIDTDITCKYAFEENNKSKFLNKDVTEITGMDLMPHYTNRRKKILVGCAPCQPFSSYTFKDKEKNNTKWTLLYEFIRIIEELDPEIISMENVPQLLNFKKANIFQDFVDFLLGKGYFLSYSTVYCPDYGIPQKRKRLVLLASRLGKIQIIPETHTPDMYITVRDVIGKLPFLKHGESDENDLLHVARKLSPLNQLRINSTPYGGGWSNWPNDLLLKCHKKVSGKSYNSVYGRMLWEEPSPTITTHCIGFGNGRFGHPEQNRAISLREAALLQTFPKTYKFYQSGREFSTSCIARQLGNAVPVKLGQVIAMSIKEHLKNIS